MDREDCLIRMRKQFANLVGEGRRLSNKDLGSYSGKRFMDIVYTENNLIYTYARIEILTGDIYTRTGKKPRGNIFDAPWYGFDVIDANGVIISGNERTKRVAQLTQQ